MKHFLTSLLLGMSLVAPGQRNPTLDFTLSGSHTYRTIHPQGVDRSTASLIRDLQGTVGKSNWSVGLALNQQFTASFHIRIGFVVASLGYTSKQLDLRYASEYDSNMVYTFDPTLPHKRVIAYDHLFFEFPVSLHHGFDTDRKASLYVEAGLAPTIYITTYTRHITDLDHIPSFANYRWPDFRRLQISAKIAVGLNYCLSHNMQLFLQPALNYQLLNSTHFTIGHHIVTQYGLGVVKEHLYAIGIELGTRKSLR